MGGAQAFGGGGGGRVWIRGNNGEGSDKTCRLTVKIRIPGAAEVRRFPNPAVVRRHVEKTRLARNAGNRNGATAAKRADQSPVKILVHRRVIRLGGKGERKKKNAEHGDQNQQEGLVHS